MRMTWAALNCYCACAGITGGFSPNSSTVEQDTCELNIEKLRGFNWPDWARVRLAVLSFMMSLTCWFLVFLAICFLCLNLNGQYSETCAGVYIAYIGEKSQHDVLCEDYAEGAEVRMGNHRFICIVALGRGSYGEVWRAKVAVPKPFSAQGITTFTTGSRTGLYVVQKANAFFPISRFLPFFLESMTLSAGDLWRRSTQRGCAKRSALPESKRVAAGAFTWSC